MIYKYNSCLGFIAIKNNEEVKDMHNEIFNNIPHFIKTFIRVNCLQDGFVVYNDKALLIKWEVIPNITDSMIPVDLCQNNENVNNFTTDDIRSKFEVFQREK